MIKTCAWGMGRDEPSPYPYFAAVDSVAGGAAIIAAKASSAPPDSALANASARRRARSSMFFCARVRMMLPPFSVESAVIIDETMTPMTWPLTEFFDAKVASYFTGNGTIDGANSVLSASHFARIGAAAAFQILSFINWDRRTRSTHCPPCSVEPLGATFHAELVNVIDKVEVVTLAFVFGLLFGGQSRGNRLVIENVAVFANDRFEYNIEVQIPNVGNSVVAKGNACRQDIELACGLAIGLTPRNNDCGVLGV